MSDDSNKPIALVLSGGGIRAMAFHLGVLKVMAENNLLERVQYLSTVSGGSLLIGLVMKSNGNVWPSSEGFLSDVYPTLREQLCHRSLLWGALRRLFNPFNFRFILSRANLLAGALRNEWGITGSLNDLPNTPEWSINGTTAETGKRFRFKRADMGDYVLGYASTENMCTADALAVSAAFPGGFGPLTLEARKFNWFKQLSWKVGNKDKEPIAPLFPRIRLYDGGVYDNLGLEPYFDASTVSCRIPNTFVVVSDAGAPLQMGFKSFKLSPWRFKRVADIMSDQSRSLRIRTFMNYLQSGVSRGAYLNIQCRKIGLDTSDTADFAMAFPTSLAKLTVEQFDMIAGHGSWVTFKNIQQYRWN